MQLLYAEYNNFSVRRLQYLVQVRHWLAPIPIFDWTILTFDSRPFSFWLVQANPDSPQGDPDTPPQKYFTIMVENIPGHLRSAAALYKFFEKLFPGEVSEWIPLVLTVLLSSHLTLVRFPGEVSECVSESPWCCLCYYVPSHPAIVRFPGVVRDWVNPLGAVCVIMYHLHSVGPCLAKPTELAVCGVSRQICTRSDELVPCITLTASGGRDSYLIHPIASVLD